MSKSAFFSALALNVLPQAKVFCFAHCLQVYHSLFLSPLHVLMEHCLIEMILIRDDGCQNPTGCPSCLPCYDSIHSPVLCLSVQRSSRLDGNNIHSPKCCRVCFLFVNGAPFIAVKLILLLIRHHNRWLDMCCIHCPDM